MCRRDTGRTNNFIVIRKLKDSGSYPASPCNVQFVLGEREKTVSVAVLDDAHDQGSETFTVTLANVRGNAWLADATATGTIENSDALPRAWLVRFGRTVAEQVMEAVEGRFSAGRSAGVEVRLAGHALEGAAEHEREALEEREAERRLEAMSRWLAGEREDEDARPSASGALTARDVVLGSSFALTGGTPEDGYASLWAHGAVVALRRARGRALALGRGDELDAGRGLGARVRCGGADAHALTRRRVVPRRGRGPRLLDAHRALPLRAPCAG